MKIPTVCTPFDASLASYPRLPGEQGDSARIARAIQDCERGVLYIPKGLYEIDEMIEITNCYADTGMIGFLVTENARLVGCNYFNNYTYKMDDVTVIDHRSGELMVINCMLRKDSPNATLYKGDKSHVVWQNNMLTGGMEY